MRPGEGAGDERSPKLTMNWSPNQRSRMASTRSTPPTISHLPSALCSSGNPVAKAPRPKHSMSYHEWTDSCAHIFAQASGQRSSTGTSLCLGIFRYVSVQVLLSSLSHPSRGHNHDIQSSMISLFIAFSTRSHPCSTKCARSSAERWLYSITMLNRVLEASTGECDGKVSGESSGDDGEGFQAVVYHPRSASRPPAR